MTSFFKKHKRTPAELVTKLGNAFRTLKGGGGEEKVLRSAALFAPCLLSPLVSSRCHAALPPPPSGSA